MKCAITLGALSSVILFSASLAGCLAQEEAKEEADDVKKSETTVKTESTDAPKKTESRFDNITLGAGCFWCIEAVLERIKGIDTVESGYCNGEVANPTYQAVCTGRTGHAEVVKVRFDTKELSLEKLLDIFYELHDPTTLNRQGADRGTQYRSGIYYHHEEQKKAAVEVTKRWNESGKYKDPIITEIVKADTFYPAEEYHQDFYKIQPEYGYCRAIIYPKLKKMGLLKAPE
jgi:methionine-S-sulfoxide reductase